MTCDDDEWRSDAPPAVNCTIFADEEIDRSPTGSGVTARVALQVAKGQVPLKKKRTFEAAGTWSRFTGVAVEKLDYHGSVKNNISGYSGMISNLLANHTRMAAYIGASAGKQYRTRSACNSYTPTTILCTRDPCALVNVINFVHG